MSRGENIKKKKVKIITQIEKIVETDMDMWYGTKHIKNIYQSQEETMNVSSRMNYL